MKEKSDSSRRSFLRTCVAGAMGLGATKLAIPATVQPDNTPKSKVVVARDPQLYGTGSSLDPVRVQKLMDRAMLSFYDVQDPVVAWKKVVHPGDVVGLKVNTIAGPGLSTSVALVDAICERLKQAGIKPNDIVVWDRTNRELTRAGYHLSNDPNRERVIGSDDKSIGYEDKQSVYGTTTTRFSKLLTRTCTCMINVPILKDHSGAGVTAAMKNMYGVVDNPNDFHSNNCCPYVADLYMHSAIKDKFRLSICDMFTACYEGGPSFQPQHTWKFNGLMIASDPVAHDYTAWQIIERKRAEKGLKTLTAAGRPPKYIAVAADAQHRLGTNDPQRITLVEL